MKTLHRSNLFAWSAFNQERNIDFNATLYKRDDGNVLIDPLPLSEHDRKHLEELGGAEWVVITNSDHVRATADIARQFGASVAGPAKEKDDFPLPCDRWLSDGNEVVAGLIVSEMHGSKTPGELALLLDGHTLISGDLIRAHRAGTLMLLPDAKLSDREAALASVKRLLMHRSIDAVLVGDGWHVFRDGYDRLEELLK